MNRTYQLTTNKFLEIESYCSLPTKGCNFELSFYPKWKTDHAGFRFCFAAFGFTLYLSFYDSRHWDDSTNNFYI